MKIKRYVSRDLRSAVQTARNELGAGAIIISQHHVPEGIEVTAAVDDELCYKSPAQPHPEISANSQSPSHIKENSRQQSAPQKKARYFSIGNTNNLGASNSNNQFSGINKNCEAASRNDSCTVNNFSTQSLITKSVTENDSMKSAVSDSKYDQDKVDYFQSSSSKCHDSTNLVSLVEQQITEHAWGDIARKNPRRAQLIRQLLKLDLHPLIIQKVTEAISEDNVAPKAIFPHVLAVIANQIPIYKEDVTACGGTVALFGATGVGKTTTIAKMAARFALKHGRDKVGLVTTDSNRLGAKEQLGLYSRLLGIPLKVVHDDLDLLNALNSFSDKTFVLIDTAGMGPKEINSSKYLELFSGAVTQIKNFLVLPATTHRAVLENTAKAFQGIKLDGSIFTRLDETASLGGPISVAIMNSLPVAYFSNGQKIPDDFHLARAHNLVSRAVSVADQIAGIQTANADARDNVGIETNVSI